MRDSYSSTNSQNIAQGSRAQASIDRSVVQVGATFSDRKIQIDSLKDLELIIDKSLLNEKSKETVKRHLQNAREEMEKNVTPNPDEIGRWLNRADLTLKAAGAATDIMEGLNKVLNAFSFS